LALCLLSGPATVVQPRSIGLLDLAPTRDDELYVHQLNKDHRLFFHGDFSGFHTYCLVTHTKFKIIEGSVIQTGHDKFQAKIYYELENGKSSTKVVGFNSPILPMRSVSACKYGRDLDSFELDLFNGYSSQKYICDLSFMISYATNLDFLIPLEIEYIGMAAKNGRTAQERLGEGHKKLQSVLAELNDRDLFRSVSIVLYKPGELDSKDITFPEVVETLEASLIQYFKPKPLNKEHLDFPNNKTKLTSKLKCAGVNQIITHIESPQQTSIYSNHKRQPLKEHTFFVNVP